MNEVYGAFFDVSAAELYEPAARSWSLSGEESIHNRRAQWLLRNTNGAGLAPTPWAARLRPDYPTLVGV
jgi:hypothetical protein